MALQVKNIFKKDKGVFAPAAYKTTINPNLILPETQIQQVSLESLQLKEERIKTIETKIINDIENCIQQSRETKPTNCPNWYYSPIDYITLETYRWTLGTPQFKLTNIFAENINNAKLTLELKYVYEQYVNQRRKDETQLVTREETISRSAQTEQMV